MMIETILKNEAELLNFASVFATLLNPPLVVYLQGDLGAGKTTFVRGLVRGLNFDIAVKSPTYTLVEEYDLPWGPLYHFDLYRIIDGEELEFIGIREYFTPNAILFIEWAEKGMGFLPPADILLNFEILETGRKVKVTSTTVQGSAVLQLFNKSTH